jgi:hypothetical protein
MVQSSIRRMVMDPNGGSRPIPDPTLLTTEQLLREISNLRENFNIRLDAMDKAVVLSTQNLSTLSLEIEKKIAHLAELTEAHRQSIVNEMKGRLHAIDSRFSERDVRAAQMSEANRMAIDTALQSVRDINQSQIRCTSEAAQKTELSTTKQIDQMGALIQASVGAIQAQMGDVKDRITKIESMKLGAHEVTTNQQSNVLSITAIIGTITAIALVIVDLLVRWH